MCTGSSRDVNGSAVADPIAGVAHSWVTDVLLLLVTGLVQIWPWEIYFPLLSGSASFSLCCADESTGDKTVLSVD